MKVFISWSGPLSHDIAKAFKDWLPSVIQATKPYLSSEDVDKGARWFAEVGGELEESQMGILILTRGNMDAPWINFEAGALSKSLGISRVCPVLFGISPTDITGPLAQFQATPFGKDEILKLVKTINQALGELKLDNDTLQNVFKTFWPQLEERVKRVSKEKTNGEPEEVRSDREMIEELLNLTRRITSSLIAPPMPRRRGREPSIGLFRLIIERVGQVDPMIADDLSSYSNLGISENGFNVYFDDPSFVTRLEGEEARKLINGIMLSLNVDDSVRLVPLLVEGSD